MSDVYGGVDYAKIKSKLEEVWQSDGAGREALRETLREELDVHSAFTWEKFLREGVDAHFNARIRDLNDKQYAANPSDYWKQPETGLALGAIDGELTCPETLHAVAIYSKQTYNFAAFKTRFPTTLTDGQKIELGFENGSLIGTGICMWRFTRVAGAYKLQILVGGRFDFGGRTIDMTSALPADWNSTRHVYSVLLLKPWSEFYIDNDLVGLAINTTHLNFSDISYPPYAIFRAESPFSTKQTAILACIGEGKKLTAYMSPHNTRLSNVPELPPRVFRLYNIGSNSLLVGSSIASGSVTSHPFPVLGYQNKTIYFQATQAGTLNLEVLMQTDNWRIYDSVNVSADKLLTYVMDGQAVLARVTFTPSSYPATISEAEVVLA